MKQLTCDMCGGTDLVKQDGMFVCQTCGTKYSVEEARKMMVEGTVEVQGTVQVVNSAQVANLLKMARNAFDSKNFAKAEQFCDQVISMDDKNYDAWKLKGEAINFQINAKNPRILEAYNCIMASYRVLGDDMDDLEKSIKTLEVAQSLKVCMEGEIDFWVNQFEIGRPTDSSLEKIKSTYFECYKMMKDAYEEFGYDHTEYLKNFDNYFCYKCNSTCVSAWNTTVAYNYFRDDLDNLGASWNRNLKKNEYISSQYYRPNEEIRTTFMNETGNLINLLEFCIDRFNDITPPKTKENIYSNIAYFYRVPIDQVSYTAMVSTTTNGYGAVVDRTEYYVIDYYLTDTAKQSRRSSADSYEKKAQEAIEEGIRLAEEKKAAYWKEHAEEKTSLENERESLNTQINEFQKQIEALPESAEVKTLQSHIDALNKEKSALGFFKIKEKKALQEQIDSSKQTIADKIEKEKTEIQAKIDPLSVRIKEIDNELNKER